MDKSGVVKGLTGKKESLQGRLLTLRRVAQHLATNLTALLGEPGKPPTNSGHESNPVAYH